MDLLTLGTNLRRLRIAAGRSQAEVAKGAGITRAAYRNIESGAASPRVNTIASIARALEVDMGDLFSPVRELRRVRFRALKRMNTREQVLAEVSRWLEDYREVEAMVGEDEGFAFGPVASEVSGMAPGPARARKAAEQARRVVKLGPNELIRDICGLLEDNGVKVFTPEVASEGFFGLSVSGGDDGGPAVVVNVWDRVSVERWIFTAAHELGHLLLHLTSNQVDESTEDKGQEVEANTVASHLLMPEETFRKEWEEARGLGLVDRVLKVKSIFRVSYATVLYRVSTTHPMGERIWPVFAGAYKARFGHGLARLDEPDGLLPEDFRQGSPAPGRADEPEHLRRWGFVHDRLSRLVRKAVEEEKISLSRAAEISRVDLETMRARANSWLE
ncbi:MAG: DNA-binding protein [Deltaproteobacteria bacterium HGW-Deltaproteobacteria-20]|nr:MAG: DNA-binding protein [Deltaproteobacteria bacterium HGW-Deltaproteobacteria-20]